MRKILLFIHYLSGKLSRSFRARNTCFCFHPQFHATFACMPQQVAGGRWSVLCHRTRYRAGHDASFATVWPWLVTARTHSLTMCYCSLKERHASARVNTVQPKTLNPEPEHPVGNARVCTMVSQSIDLRTLLLLLLVVARLPVHFV